MHKQPRDTRKRLVWSKNCKASGKNSKAAQIFEMPWNFFQMPWKKINAAEKLKNAAFRFYFTLAICQYFVPHINKFSKSVPFNRDKQKYELLNNPLYQSSFMSGMNFI